MKMTKTLALGALLGLALSACAAPGEVGDECSADEDCAEGLECHLHEGEDDHGECEEHHDDDEDDHEDE